MRRVRSLLPLVSCLTWMAGCGVEAESPAILGTVTPSRAYSDATVAISLMGSLFRPSLEVDTQSGAAERGPNPFSVFLDRVAVLALSGPPPVSPRPAGPPSIAATDAQWRSSSRIDARLPAGIAPGDTPSA